MDFRDEYKKEITELSSGETTERIRREVMARLSQSGQTETEVREKKPLPMKRIALIGGSIAACLVIGFTVLTAYNRFINLDSNMMVPGQNAGAMQQGGGSRPNSINGDANDVTGNANEGISLDGNDYMSSPADGSSASDAQSVPPSANSASESGGDPKFPEADTGLANGETVITLDSEGFTIDSGSSRYRFSLISPDVSAGGLTDDFPDEHIEARSADGTRYIIAFREDDVLLASIEYEVLGIYVFAG